MKTRELIVEQRKILQTRLEKLLDYNQRQVYLSALNTFDWILDDNYFKFLVNKNHESLNDSFYSHLFTDSGKVKSLKDEVSDLNNQVSEAEYKLEMHITSKKEKIEKIKKYNAACLEKINYGNKPFEAKENVVAIIETINQMLDGMLNEN